MFAKAVSKYLAVNLFLYIMFLDMLYIFKSSEDDDSWIPMHEEVEVAVAAVGEDWGSSDTVLLSPAQSVAWTLTYEEQGLRFR